MTDPIETTIQTYDTYAATYAEINASHRPVAYLYDVFVEYEPRGRLLDVGCGHGRDTAHFAKRGFEAHGVDRSTGLLAIARQAAPRATFTQGDMRHLPYRDRAFDALWVCASLLHVPKAAVPLALRELRRVLAPGGLMYIGVKHGEGEHMIPAESYGNMERFFALYQAEELGELVRAAGFRVLENAVRGGWVNLYAR